MNESQHYSFARTLAGMVLAGLILSGMVLAGLPGGAASAQQRAPGESVNIPALWPLDQRLIRPDTSRVRRIRFLTEPDYPPFNYIDGTGQLVGFNVELAAAICTALKIECSVKTRTFTKLFEELEAGNGDAIIASVAINAENRGKVDFTDRYYLTPARFAAKTGSAITGVRPSDLAGKVLGVVEGTAHEAYARAHYPGANITAFKTRAAARKALMEGGADIVFDDGISLSFWLHGKEAQGCCAFAGGPFLDPGYFGEGVGIAVKSGNDALRRLLNYALREVYVSGKYEEIFLRYFPLSFY